MKNSKKFIILAITSLLILAFVCGCTGADSFKFAMDAGDTEDIVDLHDESGVEPKLLNNSNNSANSKKSYSKSSESIGGAELITPSDFISTTAGFDRQDEKAYTIMIYMNGSDLESEYEAATDDIQEMFEADFDSDNINLIIFTGGTTRWHTREIPNNINALFKLDPKSGQLLKLAEVGKTSMGNPEVLAGFINFCYQLFPARNYGLIFWNHGGGAVVGYGADERYERNPDRAMMRLSEIDSAFASTDLIMDNQILEFIGFDTCLMSTIEMACIAGKYAKYMIASEELEPGPGWDYWFLGEVTPDMTGYDIGRVIIDYYADFYLYAEEKEITTLSMTDLTKIQAVADSFEALAAAAGYALASGEYNTISKARSKSRMFGSYEEHGGGSDMIDAVHLAESLSALLPVESAAMLGAIEQAVVYKHENNIERLGGLSIYFPFTNKYDIDYYISIYKTMNQLPNYTEFIEEFSNILMSSPMGNYRSAGEIIPKIMENGNCSITIETEYLENLAEVYLTVWKKTEITANENDETPVRYIQIGKSSKADIQSDGTIAVGFDKTWTTLNGHQVCLYEIAGGENYTRYAIPARMNGRDVDLIAIYGGEYPDGKIIGAVPTNEDNDTYNVLNKKMIRIEDGDIIQILYYARDDLFDKNTGSLWYESEEFTVDGELILDKTEADGEYSYGIILVDTQKNDYNTAIVETIE